MKIILVPTDFSDHALFALKVAASIARKLNATINLVHVYNLPSAGFDGNLYYDKFYRELKLKANKQLNELIHLDFLKDINIKKTILTNMLMWEITKHDKYKNVDLIVLGSHGTSGFNKTFIGSNTEKIVRLADAPVLTIKNDIENFDIKKMVFVSDFLEESYSVFKKIKFFADTYNAHIDLLKVITPKDFESTSMSQKLINEFAIKFQLRNFSINIYNDLSKEKGIIDFAEKIDADLIAMETHGRIGFAHLINGSLAEDIVKHEAKPVLSIKMQNLSEYTSKLISLSENYKNWGDGL